VFFVQQESGGSFGEKQMQSSENVACPALLIAAQALVLDSAVHHYCHRRHKPSQFPSSI
jgi:hypothetical protein